MGGADIKFLWGSILNRLLKWWDGRNPCKSFWKRRNVPLSTCEPGFFNSIISHQPTSKNPGGWSGNLAYYCKLSFGMTLSYVGPRCIVFDLRKYPGPQAWNRSVLFRASQQRYRDESPGMGERNVWPRHQGSPLKPQQSGRILKSGEFSVDKRCNAPLDPGKGLNFNLTLPKKILVPTV